MARVRKLGLGILLGLVIVGLIGTAALAEQKVYKYKFFIVSHGGAADPFWAVVRRGMEDAARLLSYSPEYEIEATYFGPKVASPEEVVKLMDAAIAANPDGIAVTITDPRIVDEVVRRAIEKGIPVIAINVPDMRPEPEKIPYMFYVGGDEYLGGVKAAKILLKAAAQKGITIKGAVCAPQEVGHIGLETRCRGFCDVMSDNGIPCEKLQIYGEDPTRSVEILRSYFAAHPETNALFTTGPQGTLPAIQFLKEAGMVGKILHVTYDLDPVTLDAIKSGITLATIVQQQYLQGFLPIVFLTLYNRFLLAPASDVLTGPAVVDITNVERVEELIKEGYW